MSDLYKKYANKISNEQDLLRDIDPKNSLLNMVIVDGYEIKYNFAISRYEGKSLDRALREYVTDLKKEVKKLKPKKEKK